MYYVFFFILSLSLFFSAPIHNLPRRKMHAISYRIEYETKK